MFTTLTISNWSISFLNIYSTSGSESSIKNIEFDNITISDSEYSSRDDLIVFGPILTGAKLSIIMRSVIFNNLNFINLASMIHINVQTAVPFVIENCSFTNIYGGSILLEPVSTSSGTNKVSLKISNITVNDNDFSTKTLFVLQKYWTLSVADWTMKRNSGYFYGTIVSILGDDSTANFTNCNFNNNNGVNGGLFYVSSSSTVYLLNWLLFSNFAVNAAVAYVENLGNININNWDISFNIALLTGIIQVVDTTVPISILSSKIYSNRIVTYNTTVTEIENPNIWINLWFASNGFINFLLENKNVLEGKVVMPCLHFR